jgi:hypothetical protein
MGYKRKTRQIWTRGAAPSSNPDEFCICNLIVIEIISIWVEIARRLRYHLIGIGGLYEAHEIQAAHRLCMAAEMPREAHLQIQCTTACCLGGALCVCVALERG